MQRERFRKAVEEFLAGMLEYRTLLLSKKYDDAETLRSKLNIAYGSVREDLRKLNLPTDVHMSGRVFPVFETGLQRFDPTFGFPIVRAIDGTIQVLETAIGLLGTEGEQNPSLETEQVRPSKVFLVHGHDLKSRDMVARYLDSIGADPIILCERPGKGRTLIQKLEEEGLDASFAVVLLTGDDVGAERGQEASLKPRSRQNVILELGYFIGELGRKQVVVLYEAGVEMPTDYGGVEYIPLRDDWKTRLGKELLEGGIPVDLNKAR